jgi:hypothetical protein
MKRVQLATARGPAAVCLPTVPGGSGERVIAEPERVSDLDTETEIVEMLTRQERLTDDDGIHEVASRTPTLSADRRRKEA